MSAPVRESQIIPFLLTLILILAWLAPGLVGHEPWKGDEAETVGLVHSILSDSPLAIPTLAGEPWPDSPPPLYALVAAAFAQWLAPVLPVHDGARLAGGFFILCMLIFAALTGRELYGHRHGRLVSMVLVGSVGLWFAAHESIPQSALLCGVAMTGYGAALSPRRTLLGGMWAGTGLGVSFMSSGIIEPVALVCALLSLPLLSPVWRSANTLKFALSAIIFSLPWMLIWPWQAAHTAPAWLHLWWQHQYQQFVMWSPKHDVPTWYYIEFLPWFSWPAWPLALWTLSQARHHRQLQTAGIVLPLSLWVCTTVVMSLTTQPNPELGLPILLPLAWLAAGGTATVRRGAANAMYWFAIMTFAVVAIAAWVYWSALDMGFPVRLAHHLHTLQPQYAGSLHMPQVGMAILYCLVWGILLARMKRSPQRPLLAWAAGMVLAWGLAAFLFVSPIDQRMSFVAVAQSIAPHLPENDCIVSMNVSADARAMFDYYDDIRTLSASRFDQYTCPFLLTENTDIPLAPPQGWHEVWHGARAGNHVEHFILYQRRSLSNHADNHAHPLQ